MFHCVDEFNALQGRADFVMSPTNLEMLDPRMINKIMLGIDSPSSAIVFTTICKNKKIDVEKIVEATGLSKTTVLKCISNFNSLEIIERDNKERFRISSSFTFPSIELWAVELKLSNWKRALFQSMQYRAFSHCSMVVVPKESSRLIIEHADAFKKNNIRVLVIDSNQPILNTLISNKKEKPSINHNHVFAVASFLRRVNEEKNRIATEKSE